MIVNRVQNDSVWGSLRILFIGSGLLFLINNYFGFTNSLTAGEIPRPNLLIHLHAGSIGWITLSAIGIAIWVLTGDREVSPVYESRIRSLVWAAVIIFALYIPNFWLAFSGVGRSVVALLPIFGAAAVIVLWISAIYALSQLRNQSVVTTVQILAAGALLVAAIGATVGMLLGMERAIGRFLPLPEADRVGAHAGMMDTYLFLVAGAVIEWFTMEDRKERWSIAGLIQAVAWAVGASLVPIAFFTNSVPVLLPVFLVLLLLGLVIFLARIAWRAILAGPTAEGGKSWTFFGTIWLVVFMALFLWAVSQMDFSLMPPWFGAVFAHSGFVGMMTNLLLGVLAARAFASREVFSWGEPTAMWLLNLGLLVFFALKIAMDVRLGAIVMGVGVVLGVITMLLRLRASDGPSAGETPMATPAGGGTS